MDMPRMTNPDAGSEKTHMPGATAKDKRRIWFERRVLGHPQVWKEQRRVICSLLSTKEKVWPKKAQMF